MRAKSRDNLQNLLILILILVAFYIYYQRFHLKNPRLEFRDIETMSIVSKNERNLNFYNIIKEAPEVYVLFLEISNCSSCISRGFDEVNSLEKAGKL